VERGRAVLFISEVLFVIYKYKALCTLKISAFLRCHKKVMYKQTEEAVVVLHSINNKAEGPEKMLVINK